MTWIGRRLGDAYGAQVGRVDALYVDAIDREPVWVAVRLGRFGDECAVVPLAAVDDGPDGLRVRHERLTIRSAPAIAPGAPLRAGAEQALARHYGLDARARELARERPDAITAAPARAARSASLEPA